eukprot:4058250-Pleurochrysis_carterae.AAC.1
MQHSSAEQAPAAEETAASAAEQAPAAEKQTSAAAEQVSAAAEQAPAMEEQATAAEEGGEVKEEGEALMDFSLRDAIGNQAVSYGLGSSLELLKHRQVVCDAPPASMSLFVLRNGSCRPWQPSQARHCIIVRQKDTGKSAQAVLHVYVPLPAILASAAAHPHASCPHRAASFSCSGTPPPRPSLRNCRGVRDRGYLRDERANGRGQGLAARIEAGACRMPPGRHPR